MLIIYSLPPASLTLRSLQTTDRNKRQLPSSPLFISSPVLCYWLMSSLGKTGGLFVFQSVRLFKVQVWVQMSTSSRSVDVLIFFSFSVRPSVSFEWHTRRDRSLRCYGPLHYPFASLLWVKSLREPFVPFHSIESTDLTLFENHLFLSTLLNLTISPPLSFYRCCFQLRVFRSLRRGRYSWYRSSFKGKESNLD